MELPRGTMISEVFTCTGPNCRTSGEPLQVPRVVTTSADASPCTAELRRLLSREFD